MIGKVGFCLFIGGAIAFWFGLNTFYGLGISAILLILLRGVDIGKSPYRTRKRRN